MMNTGILAARAAELPPSAPTPLVESPAPAACACPGHTAETTLLAMASDELRTPLAGILGVIELLEDTPLNSGQHALLATARRSATRMLERIDGLLHLAALERPAAGPANTDETFDPTALARGLTLDLVEPAVEKGLWLDCQVAAGVPERVRGDAASIRRALHALADNAVKFTARGQVLVALDSAAAPAGGMELRFSVTDTGPGIDAARSEDLFLPFVQGDASLGRRHGGLGVGLALAQGLVARLGGRIACEPAPGGGSRFWFTVPVRPPAVPDRTPLPVAEEVLRAWARERGGRILVVDDSATNRMLTAGMLTRAGFRVTCAAGGVEALDRLRDAADPIEAVLMDVAMPDVDGIAATAALRRLPGAAGRVPVIAMTAHALPGDRDRFLAEGMDDYVAKPARPADLLAVLARWLDR